MWYIFLPVYLLFSHAIHLWQPCIRSRTLVLPQTVFKFEAQLMTLNWKLQKHGIRWKRQRGLGERMVITAHLYLNSLLHNSKGTLHGIRIKMIGLKRIFMNCFLHSFVSRNLLKVSWCSWTENTQISDQAFHQVSIQPSQNPLNLTPNHLFDVSSWLLPNSLAFLPDCWGACLNPHP